MVTAQFKEPGTEAMDMTWQTRTTNYGTGGCFLARRVMSGPSETVLKNQGSRIR